MTFTLALAKTRALSCDFGATCGNPKSSFFLLLLLLLLFLFLVSVRYHSARVSKEGKGGGHFTRTQEEEEGKFNKAEWDGKRKEEEREVVVVFSSTPSPSPPLYTHKKGLLYLQRRGKGGKGGGGGQRYRDTDRVQTHSWILPLHPIWGGRRRSDNCHFPTCLRLRCKGVQKIDRRLPIYGRYRRERKTVYFCAQGENTGKAKGVVIIRAALRRRSGVDNNAPVMTTVVACQSCSAAIYFLRFPYQRK